MEEHLPLQTCPAFRFQKRNSSDRSSPRIIREHRIYGSFFRRTPKSTPRPIRTSEIQKAQRISGVPLMHPLHRGDRHRHLSPLLDAKHSKPDFKSQSCRLARLSDNRGHRHKSRCGTGARPGVQLSTVGGACIAVAGERRRPPSPGCCVASSRDATGGPLKSELVAACHRRRVGSCGFRPARNRTQSKLSRRC